jgi:hypothetical protein
VAIIKTTREPQLMFCRLVIIVLLVLADLRVHAAALKGVILANEVGGSPMANVLVAADGTNQTVSDAWGRFALEFPRKIPGDPVHLIVKKEGYVVVNDIQLLDATIPANPDAKLLTIVLSKADDREEMARRFYGLQNFVGTAIRPAETPSKSEGMGKSFPSPIYMARRDLFPTLMHWHIPKDSAELALAFGINLGALSVIYFIFVIALYGIAPAKFAAWHEWIANRGIPFGENVSKFLSAFLLDTPYCLNAVVRRYLERARKSFDNALEVKTRGKWVAAPFLIGDELFQYYEPPSIKRVGKPYVAGLQEIKARLGKGDERWTISIEGPGGVGKSALAFEIARWASDSRRDYRLAPFPILPILLPSLERGTDKAKTVDAAAAAQLRSVMKVVKISDPLLQALLSRKRVLAVLDGFSEIMRDETDEMIRPENGTVYTQAVVITSRVPMNLPDSLVIRPQGLTLAFPDRVLDDLIAANVGSGSFNDGSKLTELRRHVRSLIEGAKERQVPMIFIKLMIERADQLLNEDKQLDELPITLAELVTEYTEQLLRNEQDLTFAVQQARIAAHVCMGKERIPVDRSEARYTSVAVTKGVLHKFVTAGLMVRSGEKSDPFYKFALDPLAEQLDANRIVIGIRDGSADQTEIDDLIQQWEKLPEDFIRALRRAAAIYRDCVCVTQPEIVVKLWPQEANTMQKPAHSLSARDLSVATLFLSYRLENDAHRAAVRKFGERLRAAGIKVLLDQFYLDANPGGPDEGWPAWSKNQALKSEKILIVGSPGWYRCYNETEVPGFGLGTAVEGRVIAQRIYNDSGLNRIARLVVFDSADKLGVPLDLQSYHLFHAVSDFDDIVGWIIGTVSAASTSAFVTEPSKAALLINRGKPQIFVSYAWGDDASEDAWKRAEVVERMCETLDKEDWQVVRDKGALMYGDLISTFMKRLTQADRVIVVLSAKYLRSPYCMTELHAIYKSAREEKQEFLNRIIPLVLEDASFDTPEERVEHAKHWEARYLKLKADLDYLSVEDFGLYQNMRKWYTDVGNILAYVNDVLVPHGFESIVKDDFATLRQMLQRRR